jgi:acyl carrier protein
MYRTGDRGHFEGDVLHFDGRLDEQLKLRGFRIEPGDIEAATRADAGVAEAVAALRQFSPGDTRLVLYVCARQPDADLPARLRERLREALPAYMRPQQIALVDEIPRTPNGKTDRAALARQPLADAPAPAPPVTAASDGDTAYLAAIWRELIGVAEVGPADNFFELGGDSLLAVDMLTRVERETGVRLNVIAIAAGTLESLSAQVAMARAASRGGWFGRLVRSLRPGGRQ